MLYFSVREFRKRAHESDTQRGGGQDESKRARVVYSSKASKDGSKEAMSIFTTDNEVEGRAKASERENIISMTSGLLAVCLVAP